MGEANLTELRLRELWRFPVKSMRGGRCARLTVGQRGFEHDREWMVVDASHRFLTQRQVTKMALVDVQVDTGWLQLAAPGMPDLAVANVVDGETIEVRIWDDHNIGLVVGPDVDAWLTEFLGQPCRLVQFPAATVRAVDPAYAQPNDQVGFADGFPFLLISQASLDDLNSRLERPVPMIRFRPNLVVTGTSAFEEDRWRRIRIGEMTFRVAKPCSRCIIPTIDPNTGDRGREPLQTLRGYRRWDNKVFFGQNLVHDGVGELTEGMAVEVLEWADV